MVETVEFSRPVKLKLVASAPGHFEANEDERAALARRFDLVGVERLEADLELDAKKQVVSAQGTMEADIIQSCAISGDDLPVAIREDLSFRFVPETDDSPAEEEIELDEEDLDEIPYSGGQLDVGEAIAQSLGLAVDPYAVGPDAEEARKKAGLMHEDDAGPFAALKALKKDK